MPKLLKAYAFSELRLKKAKEKAVKWYQENQWHDGGNPLIEGDVKECFKQRLDELGLPSGNINWSLGYCQGDGMNFKGKVDIQKYTTVHDLRSWGPMEDLVDVTIVSIDSHYCHWNTMRLEWENRSGYERDHPAAFWVSLHVTALIEHIEARIKEVSRELEAKGYEIIEGYNSYEYLSEDLEARDDLLFTWDGTPLPRSCVGAACA